MTTQTTKPFDPKAALKIIREEQAALQPHRDLRATFDTAAKQFNASIHSIKSIGPDTIEEQRGAVLHAEVKLTSALLSAARQYVHEEKLSGRKSPGAVKALNVLRALAGII